MRWIYSPAEVAHCLEPDRGVLLWRDLHRMSDEIGTRDAAAWCNLFRPLAEQWPALARNVLSPLSIPRNPLLLAGFGMKAMLPVTVVARSSFRNEPARALFAGVGAHSIKPLDAPFSSAIGIMLTASAHAVGWPIPEGGSQSITSALVKALESYGGRVVCNSQVADLREVASADLALLDVTPRQVLQMGGEVLPESYKRQLQAYRYGPGTFKVDWALSEPIPWKDKRLSESITVHVGGSLAEMAASERAAWEGKPPEKPFVLLAQQSLFDRSRAPAGQHTAWAYCHVPNGWTRSALDAIENQIERFAPGFRDVIRARSVHNTADLEAMNPNLVGGDINGGAFTVKQLMLRPTWREYATPLENVFLCSSATLPGGGVHGMCGYNAARMALARFKERAS